MAIENSVQSLTLATPEIRQRESLGPVDKTSENFSSALGKAVDSLDKLHVEADRETEQVAMGGGNLHEMAISLEKADIGLRLATKVRNKLVEAYQEIMRMSV
jgi:flagellar hook-basal body complex protein FliE